MCLGVSARPVLFSAFRLQVVILAVTQHPLYLRIAVLMTLVTDMTGADEALLPVLVAEGKHSLERPVCLRRIFPLLGHVMEVLIHFKVDSGCFLEQILYLKVVVRMMPGQLVRCLGGVLVWSVIASVRCHEAHVVIHRNGVIIVDKLQTLADIFGRYAVVVPVQYKYQMSVDNSAANVAAAFLAKHQRTGDRLALAKAIALTNTITLVQNANNGLIPTTWENRRNVAAPMSFWLNCSVSSTLILLRMSDAIDHTHLTAGLHLKE